MLYPMINQLGNERFNEMLEEAAQERRASQFRQARPERKLFNLDLGNLRISVSTVMPKNVAPRQHIARPV